MRHWSGTADIPMDGNAIVGETPIDNLYINCGWGYAGFKTTPAVGWNLAQWLAQENHHGNHKDNTPEMLKAFSLRRFSDDALIDDAGIGPYPWLHWHMLLLPCPHCGNRDESEFDYGGRSVEMPALEAATMDWHQTLHTRKPMEEWVEEFWFHTAGCERWVRLWRNPITHEFASEFIGKFVGDPVDNNKNNGGQ
ncbi:MAG: FAD-dependent oxidoreductase [Gammaproteobacteria bacterium]|nr:FAD-dependent oxidoreductase [Gammaproteobacteria bacterium]